MAYTKIHPFFSRVYIPSTILLNIVVPTVVPWYIWSESITKAFFVSSMLRYVLSLNAAFLGNSAAHIWGTKPYDRFTTAAENMLVILTTGGEGFHNYHHAFPQDYSTSEFCWWLNSTTFFIDCMAALGLVTARTKISPEIVEKRKLRTGEGALIK